MRWLGVLLGCLGLFQQVVAREWTDRSGTYKLQGTLVGFDDREVVIQLDDAKAMHGNQLVAMQREDLSTADTEFVAQAEASSTDRNLQTAQTWTMKNGLTVVGRVVDFVKRDVTVQRRRGKIYVNDKLYANLPEVYRRILLRVVEHFEGTKIEDAKGLDQWVRTLKGQPKTFTCEGVILELNNGDEYGVPFFLFSDRDLAVLKPNWDQWIASKDATAQQEHSLYLQSQAEMYQREQAEQSAVQTQVAIAQLQMMAVATGAVDLWEVYLQPGPGTVGYPIAVVVPAPNSGAASAAALERNPGYVAGPVRKVSRL